MAVFYILNCKKVEVLTILIMTLWRKKISQTEANIQQWGTIVLSAMTTPNGGNVKWSSSNTAVATVGDDGVVNAICEDEGECDIFAT